MLDKINEFRGFIYLNKEFYKNKQIKRIILGHNF